MVHGCSGSSLAPWVSRTPLALWEPHGFGRKDVVEHLLQTGASVHARDDGGLIPLHNACSFGHAEVVSLLLCQGADPNARDNWNYTPLHEAAIKGKIDVCIVPMADEYSLLHDTDETEFAHRVLLQHGADPNIRNTDGKSALDLADPSAKAVLTGSLQAKHHRSDVYLLCHDTSPVSKHSRPSMQLVLLKRPYVEERIEGGGSPIWPVCKSDGEWRLTVDYCALNEVTPPLSAAMPTMLKLQYELESKAAKWCTTTDIANAIFSIPLAAECRPQFAFTWRGIQCIWNQLPQGWKHSPTKYHGLIQAALEKGEAPEHLQYIDDIIVWGNMAVEVFAKQIEYGGTMNLAIVLRDEDFVECYQSQSENMTDESGDVFKISEYKKDELLEAARSGNEEKLMALLTPLNVNCHASDGRKGIVVAVNPKGWMDEHVMRTLLTEVYAHRPDVFFHQLPALLIFDSMRAHKTESVKAMVKNMNSEFAVIPGGLTKEVQPLDISIIRSFKAKLRLLWENWMVEGEHSFTNTGRLRWASYATVCQWILDAWSKVIATTIIRGFARADIIHGLTSDDIESTETDDSDGEDTGNTGSGLLAASIAQLLISTMEDEELKGFMEDEAADDVADE
ncbi:hypothetical protein TURU_036603 [Turdus rufiventris]|nr:hypothetical protein TURU_036603 [Turdus rufiventris]